MERKAKASEAPEGEAPAKAQRTAGGAPERAAEAPESGRTVEVPDSRLRAEVQSLLVGVDDLATTTVGQLRGSLEDRLGLDSGTLVSKRRLKRQLSRVVHDEVLKKTQRTPELARIVKALVEFEEYPAPLRQMLIDGLPHAAARLPAQDGGGAPHEHQARLLSIASDAILDARDRAATSQADREAQAADAEVTLREREEAGAAATAHEAAARARAQEAAARARDLEQEAAVAKEQLARAETAVKEAAQKAAKARQDGQIAAALRDGPLTLLRLGDGPEGKEKENAVIALQVYLSDPETNSEGSLISAAPTALRRNRGERSSFDQLTVECISECLEERVRLGDPELVAREESNKECDHLAASAMLDAMVSTAAEQNNVLADAKAAVEAAAAATVAAEAALTEQRTAVGTSAADRDVATAKRQELDEVLAIVDLMIFGRKAPAEAEAEAPADEKADKAGEDAGAAPCSGEPQTAQEPEAMDCTLPILSHCAAGEPKVVESDPRSPFFSPRRVPTTLSAGAELGA